MMFKKKINLVALLGFLVLLVFSCTDYYTQDEVDKLIDDLEDEVNSQDGETVGWGVINTAGTILGGSGNYTMVRESTGIYLLTWDVPLTTVYTEHVILASPYNSSFDVSITYATYSDGAVIRFFTFNTSGAYIDSLFSFIVYKK